MTQQRSDVEVDWSASENRPLRFSFQHRSVTVDEVVDRWPGADYEYFKVRGDDGDLYMLRHAPGDHWELILPEPGDNAPLSP